MKNSIWTGLTVLLGSICLALLALVGISVIALGNAPEIRVDAGNQGKQSAQLDELKSVSFSERTADLYTNVILRNPLFFADRTLPMTIEEDAPPQLKPEKQEPQEPVTQKLDARLVGIIITPDERIAMVADNKSQKTAILRQGMALQGEQAAWQLNNISERLVNFAAGSESTELKLEVNTKALQEPVVARRPPANNQNNQQDPAAEIVKVNNTGNADALRESTEEELRRQIAERQAELRAERQTDTEQKQQ